MEMLLPVDVASSSFQERPFQTGSCAEIFACDARFVVPSCAMKVALPGNEGALYNEYRVATALSPHPNILRPYGAAKDDSLQRATHLALPMCVGGDLHAFINTFTEAQPVPLAQGLSLLSQIMHGLLHVHRHGLVHRDIKPENIFLSDEACTLAVIGDMGLAAQSGEMMHSLTGTIGYAPPESCVLAMDAAEAQAGAPSLPSFDVWSICILAVELLTSIGVRDIITMLQHRQLENILSERLDRELANAICRGLTVSAADRITLPELHALTWQALSLTQARTPARPPANSSEDVAPWSLRAAWHPQPAADGLQTPRQFLRHTSSALDSTSSEAPSDSSTEPDSAASWPTATAAAPDAPAEAVGSILTARLSSLPPLRIASHRPPSLPGNSGHSGQATPEFADDFAVGSALALSAHSGEASPTWSSAAAAATPRARGSLPVLSASGAAGGALLEAASMDDASTYQESERKTSHTVYTEASAAASVATLASVAPMPSLPPVRVSAPGAAPAGAEAEGFEEGAATGCTALSMSAGPSPSAHASPRSSLLRRMRAVLKSPASPFRRKGDSAEVPAGDASARPGWAALLSPRKVPTVNLGRMLQTVRARMRRGSAVEL